MICFRIACKITRDVSVSLKKTGINLQADEKITNGGTTNGYDGKSTGKIKKWRIENSWGEDRNEKGFITMTTDW